MLCVLRPELLATFERKQSQINIQQRSKENNPSKTSNHSFPVGQWHFATLFWKRSGFTPQICTKQVQVFPTTDSESLVLATISCNFGIATLVQLKNLEWSFCTPTIAQKTKLAIGVDKDTHRTQNESKPILQTQESLAFILCFRFATKLRVN